jgi:HEAT repeat protein
MTRTLRLLVPALLFGALSASAQDPGPPVDFEEIDRLLVQVEEGDRPERREALDALLGRGDERIAGMVLDLLAETADKEDEKIEDILRAIGKHGVKAGYGPALERLSHREGGVRSYAAVCLERLENAEAKKELLKRAGKERDALALKNAMRALGKLCPNEKDVARALLKRFRHKESVVAANAILSCGEFTEEGRVRSMVAAEVGAMLNKTSDIRVRSACLWAISAVGTEKEIPVLEKFRKNYTNTRTPMAQIGVEMARLAEERIRAGEDDELSGPAFDRLFATASDDERDPARDGDPTKPPPPWMDGNNRGGGWRGRGR